MLIILYEERFGPHAAPNFWAVPGFNVLWVLAPAYWIYRMLRYEHPFTRQATA